MENTVKNIACGSIIKLTDGTLVRYYGLELVDDTYLMEVIEVPKNKRSKKIPRPRWISVDRFEKLVYDNSHVYKGMKVVSNLESHFKS